MWLYKEKATVSRSRGRKSTIAHYREKGAVKVSPSFILPALPAFSWPREWKLKSNSQNEWWNCTVCTKQKRRLRRVVKKGAPCKGDRQHSAVCFLSFIMTEAGVWTALVGRWTPFHFLSISTVCMVPACIKYTVRLRCLFCGRREQD